MSNLKSVLIVLATLQKVNATNIIDFIFTENLLGRVAPVFTVHLLAQVLQEVKVSDGLVHLVAVVRVEGNLFREPSI